jgi:phosphatidylserine synthase 2
MGSHAVMLLTTVAVRVAAVERMRKFSDRLHHQLESLIVLKWSTGRFPNPAPKHVKVFWSGFLLALIVYPTYRFGLRKDGRRSGRSTPVANGSNALRTVVQENREGSRKSR